MRTTEIEGPSLLEQLYEFSELLRHVKCAFRLEHNAFCENSWRDFSLQERFKWLMTPNTMRSQLSGLLKLDTGRVPRRTFREARSITFVVAAFFQWSPAREETQ